MKNNNETIGITAEYALCKLFKINCNINNNRINNDILTKLTIPIDKFINNNNIKIIKHEGYNNKNIDFILKNNKTLSLKTLKNNNGKICPQKVGQPTLKSFDKQWNLEYNGDLIYNKYRFEYIKTNIYCYLNIMLKNIYCCDYLILIKNLYFLYFLYFPL